jgi:beta-lactam-binding protein with PASTA domain
VLYEMLTARTPFTGDSPVAVAYKHVQEQPLPPSRINPSVPVPLEAIDMKLLQKDPGLRYATAEDLRSDLRRFLEGQPVAAAGHPGAAAGVVVGAGIAGAAAGEATQMVPATGAAGGAGGGNGGPPTTANDYVGPPEKKRTGLYVALVIAALAIIAIILFFVGSNMGKTTAKVTVPDVTTKDVTEATNTLSQAGFKVSVKNVANDTVPLNQVFEQTPKGNEQADKGSTVEITVSSGVGDTKVPNVTGLTQAAAESLLKTNNLVPDVTQQASDTVPLGTVISQNPAANATATKNSVVKVVVSSGPGDVTIPNVVGLSAATASNQLGQAGFNVTSSTDSSATVPSGNVISTNPTAGNQAAKGSTVSIIVSSGPAQILVPNVVGMQVNTAQNALNGAGLTSTVTTAHSLTVPVDQIISQTPAAGTSVNPGSSVTIVKSLGV